MAKGGKLVTIPEEKPITIGCYTLTATGLDVKGSPTWGEHEGVGEFIKRAHKASGWWLADWLRYGEERAAHDRKWKERLEAAEGATGLTRKTLANVRAIGAIEPSRRRADVEFGYHGEVAALPPAEQTQWLERVVVEGLDRNELRREIRVAKRTAVIEGQQRLRGQHRVLMADYPWLYQNSQPSGSNQKDHYPGMPIEEGMALPVKRHVTKHAVMGFWVPAPLLYPPKKKELGPQDLIEAWGFEYKAVIVWDKVDGAGGNYTDGAVELFLICTRGSGTPDVPRDLPHSVVTVRKSRVHSEKPIEFRRILEKHWTVGPYLELFARERHEGWNAFGNDSRLWQPEEVDEDLAEHRARHEADRAGG